MEMPQARAWFVDEPIADDDPDRDIKRHAAVLWAAGEVLEQAARKNLDRAGMKKRVDAIDAAADVLMSIGAFTREEISAMWVASGLSDGDLDSAANVGVTLLEIEELRH